MPAFGNVLLPDMTSDQLRGVWAMLEPISNPKSEAAQEFFRKLLETKDEAVAAAAQAKTDREAADAAKLEVSSREAAAQQLKKDAEKLMGEAKVLKSQLDEKHAKYLQIFGGR